jgi:hypothetical protein
MIRIVCGLMGLGGIVFAFYQWTVPEAVFLTLLLSLEAWALTNRYRGDTISEVIWWLSARPLVPFVFGLTTGGLMAADILVDRWAVALAFMLNGHFFWQAQGRDRAVRGGRPNGRSTGRRLGAVASVALAAMLPLLTGCGTLLELGEQWAEEYTKPETEETPTPEATPEPTPSPTPEPVLGAPSNLIATPGFEKVTLSWTAGENAAGYRIMRQGQIPRDTLKTEYTWEGLANGSFHTFVVRSIGYDGSVSTRSNIVEVTIPVPEPVYRTPTSARLVMFRLYRPAPGGELGTASSAIIVAEMRDDYGLVDSKEIDPKHHHQSTWRFKLAGHAAETRPGPPPRNCRVWWSTDGVECRVATAIAQYNAAKGFAVDILTKDDCCGAQDETLIAEVEFTHPGLGLKASQKYRYVVYDAPPFLDGRNWPPQRK